MVLRCFYANTRLCLLFHVADEILTPRTFGLGGAEAYSSGGEQPMCNMTDSSIRPTRSVAQFRREYNIYMDAALCEVEVPYIEGHRVLLGFANRASVPNSKRLLT